MFGREPDDVDAFERAHPSVEHPQNLDVTAGSSLRDANRNTIERPSEQRQWREITGNRSHRFERRENLVDDGVRLLLRRLCRPAGVALDGRFKLEFLIQ